MACRYDFHSLILISPFYSFQTLVESLFGKFVCKLVKNSFRNDLRIRDVKTPILLIHGLSDDFVSVENSRGLFGELTRSV